MILDNSLFVVNSVTKKVVDINFFIDIPVNLLAGIGNPDRFFDTLNMYQKIEKYVIGDHQKFNLSKIKNNHPIITTEKDALKYNDDRIWTLEVFYLKNKKLDTAFLEKLKIL